jgi:hypothetical protein
MQTKEQKVFNEGVKKKTKIKFEKIYLFIHRVIWIKQK